MTRRYGIDTSVLVRLLTGDPEKDFQRRHCASGASVRDLPLRNLGHRQPTAATSYPAAAIAQSPVMLTSVEAVKLALPAFVLPYAFMANFAFLTIGTATEVTLTVFFAVCSMIAMGMAVQAYCFRNLDPVTPLVFLAVSLDLIVPWAHQPGIGVAWTAWEWCRAETRAGDLGSVLCLSFPNPPGSVEDGCRMNKCRVR